MIVDWLKLSKTDWGLHVEVTDGIIDFNIRVPLYDLDRYG